MSNGRSLECEATQPLLEDASKRWVHGPLDRMSAEQPASREDRDHNGGQQDPWPSTKESDGAGRPTERQHGRQKPWMGVNQDPARQTTRECESK